MTEGSGMARVRRTRQYGGRVQSSEAAREGMREEVQKKGGRQAGLTCESHYSDSSSNTTFLQQRSPSPSPSSLAGSLFSNL